MQWSNLTKPGAGQGGRTVDRQGVQGQRMLQRLDARGNHLQRFILPWSQAHTTRRATRHPASTHCVL